MNRSPAVARELAINWIEADWPTSWDENYGEQALPLSALSKLSDEKNKPSLIYVAREGDAKMEKGLFGDENLVLASRFFRCYRIDAKDIPAGKISEKYLLKGTPTFIILDAKGNEVIKNKKKVSTKWINSKLKKQFAADFRAKLRAHIKKLSDWLDDLEKADDSLANAKKSHTAIEDRAAKKDKETARSRKRLAKSNAKLVEAQSAFDKLVALGKKLSNPQLKSSEFAKK